MFGQLETMVDAASKLGQAGSLVILAFAVIAMGFAIRSLFNSHQENMRAMIVALTENTKAMEAHTRALEANERSSDSNREAIAQMKMVMETFLRKGP